MLHWLLPGVGVGGACSLAVLMSTRSRQRAPPVEKGGWALIAWEQEGCWGQGRHTMIRLGWSRPQASALISCLSFLPPTSGFEGWDRREEVIILIAELPFTKSFLCARHSEWLNTLSFNP